jgi:hypothetical protein
VPYNIINPLLNEFNEKGTPKPLAAKLIWVRNSRIDILTEPETQKISINVN